MNWTEKNILIIGAARQGIALTRFLINQGANVILNDNRSQAQLSGIVDQFKHQNVECVFGSHPLSMLDETDMIAVSGGVPLEIPLIVEAKKRGIPITNDSQIFMEIVSCPVIGITGSAGKTTTTSLVGEIAKAALNPPSAAWIGGNIGTPLIDKVSEIQPDDRVILELSSFQLELMTTAPQIAAITNITPNHLDRHGTMQAYTEAKAHILDFQKNKDIAILNRDDLGAWELHSRVQGNLVSFGKSPLHPDQNGCGLIKNEIFFQYNNKQTMICHRNDIQLLGEHNLFNVMAACAISMVAGFDPIIIRNTIQKFKGVQHRLELVRTFNGVKWINDSIASAPERTIAAIDAFSEPIVLLLGGKDKNLPWDRLAALVAEKVDHVILFGDAAEKIEAALTHAGKQTLPYTLSTHPKMEEALQAAAEIVEPGDVVLLSPGATSYDEFVDFAERGERYRLWVNNLQ